ncbi:MAG: hypothetical protein ACI8PB_004550 [Desulforhopalus sp.]|jgi:hypothetical protein
MKNVYLLLLSLFITLIPASQLLAEDSATAMQRLGTDIAGLKLGFSDYFLGQKLTEQQKDNAKENTIAKTIKGSYKFQDNGVFIVASSKSDMVIGLYKENPTATQQDMKNMVGELMMQFEEPTKMAHDKLIYWAFGKDGLIPQDLFNMAKSTDSEILATVKFSSDQPIRPSEKPEEGAETKTKESSAPASIYVIITSDQLSNIFLAQNK